MSIHFEPTDAPDPIVPIISRTLFDRYSGSLGASFEFGRDNERLEFVVYNGQVYACPRVAS